MSFVPCSPHGAAAAVGPGTVPCCTALPCPALHCPALSPPNPSVFQAHLTSIPVFGFLDLSSFILHFESFSFQALPIPPAALLLCPAPLSRLIFHLGTCRGSPFALRCLPSLQVFMFLSRLPEALDLRSAPGPTSADPSCLSGSQDVPTCLQCPLLPSDCSEEGPSLCP